MAATSLEIGEQFKRLVLNTPEILAFTHSIYDEDITQRATSSSDFKAMLYCGEVNFIQFLVQRYRDDTELGCCGTFKYRVIFEYYLQDSCGAQNKIQAFFEKLDDMIESNLGNTWNNTVSLYTRDARFPSIGFAGDIDNRNILLGTYTYFAESNC